MAKFSETRIVFLIAFLFIFMGLFFALSLQPTIHYSSNYSSSKNTYVFAFNFPAGLFPVIHVGLLFLLIGLILVISTILSAVLTVVEKIEAHKKCQETMYSDYCVHSGRKRKSVGSGNQSSKATQVGGTAGLDPAFKSEHYVVHCCV